MQRPWGKDKPVLLLGCYRFGDKLITVCLAFLTLHNKVKWTWKVTLKEKIFLIIAQIQPQKRKMAGEEEVVPPPFYLGDNGVQEVDFCAVPETSRHQNHLKYFLDRFFIIHDILHEIWLLKCSCPTSLWPLSYRAIYFICAAHVAFCF